MLATISDDPTEAPADTPPLCIVKAQLRFPRVSRSGTTRPAARRAAVHSCVLDNFAANSVAAMPILYRLAQDGATGVSSAANPGGNHASDAT